MTILEKCSKTVKRQATVQLKMLKKSPGPKPVCLARLNGKDAPATATTAPAIASLNCAALILSVTAYATAIVIPKQTLLRNNFQAPQKRGFVFVIFTPF